MSVQPTPSPPSRPPPANQVSYHSQGPPTPQSRQSLRAAASAYPIGALSGGLACFAIMAFAHHRRDRTLHFHAKQA